MIRVKRSGVRTPAVLGGSKSAGAKETAEAVAFYSKTSNRKKAFGKYKIYRHQEVKDALNELFGFKCAYCESMYGGRMPVQVEHYRPKGGVFDGRNVVPPGYYWLAAAWSNLLPSCIDCNSVRGQVMPGQASRVVIGKANHFPVGRRSRRATRPGGEKKEKPLLLNPCNHRPETHLVFDELGRVFPKTNGRKRSEKGSETIRVLGLQRTELIRARRQVALRVLGQMKKVLRAADRLEDYPKGKGFKQDLIDEIAALDAFADATQEYSAMVSQMIQAFKRKNGIRR